MTKSHEENYLKEDRQQFLQKWFKPKEPRRVETNEEEENEEEQASVDSRSVLEEKCGREQ